MLDQLFKEYQRIKKRGAKRDDVLTQIISECRKLAHKLLNNYNVDSVFKDEFLASALSTVLVDSMKKYKRTRKAKFSTYYYWKLKCLSHEMFMYNQRQKRIRRSKISSIDDNPEQILISNDDIVSEVEYRDLIRTVNSKLSKKSKDVFNLICNGYSKRETFKHLRINNRYYKKIIAEIKQTVKNILYEI